VLKLVRKLVKRWRLWRQRKYPKWQNATEVLLPEEMRNRLLLWTVRSKCANTKRNDPCPCGSGKKFKVCCLPKFK
jgi:uncharacterized protein YecA (UPF0149 family)